MPVRFLHCLEINIWCTANLAAIDEKDILLVVRVFLLKTERLSHQEEAGCIFVSVSYLNELMEICGIDCYARMPLLIYPI